MSHHSLFTCALASISFLAGGLVQAGDYFISNEEDYNTSIADTLGIPLSSGCAMLGTLTNWNYNFNDAKWANGGNEYDQGNLSYSQIVDIRNNFVSTLNISPSDNGSITNGGLFSLSGSYQQPAGLTLENTPLYLMVGNGSTIDVSTEIAVFVFRKTEDGNLATYPSDPDFPGSNYLDFLSRDKAVALKSEWYAECILGHNTPDGFQLIPEPATATLGLLGLAALMMRRRR
ncbi:PEP-CTERM sorting domain-containing protein [Akkermansia sp.]|uniref:PEP-CTERM sorting domain-containing protein n=1 Tax=Akkermansia sp. TaxID=1872421 RepID=UPI0026733120|nr:PEP-CTERM sorting domain-containing protein [Akkermansia sp.]MEE0764471.1 hypothetical protein [Akkermansia sp.]